MTRSLQISKTGMDAQQSQLDVVSNSLANVDTTGLERSRVVFEDLLYQNVRESGAQLSQRTTLPSGMQTSMSTRTVATERLYTQGNLQQIGSSTSVVVSGNGFFRVQIPDGILAYTRDGDFQINAQGQLVTSSSYPVRPAVTIPQDATSLTVDKDGVAMVTTPGTVNSTQVGTFQLANFINPAGLRSIGGDLYAEAEVSGTASPANPGSNGAGTLDQGYVETPNVNAVEEMVNMIQTQCAYEINSKSIQTPDQMLEKLSQL